MAKIYAKAPDECTDRVAHLMKLFHPDLVTAGVKIDILSVATDNEGAPALTLHGYPCEMVIRVTNIKERTKGSGDAEIVIDEERYLAMSDATRDSAFDHEIYHLELRIDHARGKVKLDCRGRPKLGLRKHDVQIGHFVEIAERHGAASIECKQATQIYLQHKQTLFAFIDEDRKALPPQTFEREPVVSAKAVDQVKAYVKGVQGRMGSGESMSISSGGHGVRIDKDGIHKLENA